MRRRASAARRRPSGERPDRLRSNSVTPSDSSSRRTRCVTFDWTVLSARAARPMPPSRATAAKVVRSLVSMASDLTDVDHRYKSLFAMVPTPYVRLQRRRLSMKWHDRRLLDLFGIEHPILQAPMAGASSPQMAIAASEAGGLGAIASAMLTPETLRAELQLVRQGHGPADQRQFLRP